MSLIDQRHEELPHADAFYWARGYELIDPDRDANHEWLKIVLGVIAAGILIVVIGLASMVVAWPKDMPRGPFLGGPQYNPYGTPNNKYAGSPLKPWFDKLSSRKGLCCSFADGLKVEDVDWDVLNGRYRVRLNGNWIVVPDNALVTEPNKFGPAVVWPYQDASGVTQIRCFIPGSGA